MGPIICTMSHFPFSPILQDKTCTSKHDQHTAEEIEQIGSRTAGGRQGRAGSVFHCKCDRCIQGIYRNISDTGLRCFCEAQLPVHNVLLEKLNPITVYFDIEGSITSQYITVGGSGFLHFVVSASMASRAMTICEGAIDAISLYLIHLQTGVSVKNKAYCGIAGVANQQTIEKDPKPASCCACSRQ